VDFFPGAADTFPQMPFGSVTGVGVGATGTRTGTTMKRTRWTARIAGGLLALGGLSGCQKNIFLEPSDYKDALRTPLLNQLENEPHSPIAPSVLNPGAPPATALDPSRPPQYVTLKELIARAVESGNIGGQGGINNTGFINDTLPQFGGRAVTGTDTIRALVLDPAVAGADIERALSKFDARWINSITWSKQDQAVLNLQQSFSNGDSATFSSTLAKPLATGGVAGVTFSTNYQKLANPPLNQGFVTLPTSYTPRLQFLFEQPLLQNFGVEINQLNPQHPGSLLIGGLRPSGGTTTEGILVTRIRFDQQRAAFDQQINQQLTNVETAYWNLYSAYYNLYAQEETLKQAFDLLSIIRQRFEAGTLAKQDYTQTLGQYWLFREQVLTARQQVLNSERQLRGLLGQNSFSEGTRLVPIDEPTLAPYTPDYFEAANEALANRPELILARHDLKFRQLDLVLQKNQRRPDLRFFSSYDLNGLGSQLDGSRNFQSGVNSTTGQPIFSPQNALSSLASNQFNSWQVGLRADIPLGFRDANAATRQAQLNVLRSYYQLQDAERKTLEQITQLYRDVNQLNKLIDYRRQRRLALTETLRLNKELIEAGNWRVETLFNLLQVQRDAAGAVALEFQAIGQYNAALSQLEFAKGTIQRYNNVSVNDGPLPGFVTKRAADHFAERANALILRERPADLAPVDPANKNLPAQPFAQMPWVPATDKMMNPPAAKDPAMMPPVSPEQPPVRPAAPAPKPTGPITAAPVSPWPGTAGTVPAAPTSLPAAGDVPANPVFSPVGTVQIPQRKPTPPVLPPTGAVGGQ
jgi:outer membrane protein TolC